MLPPVQVAEFVRLRWSGWALKAASRHSASRTCSRDAARRPGFARRDHRLKQHPKWQVDQLPDGTFRWTTPSGRTYDTEPTRYPV